jgi:hypothetical protein
MDVPPARHRLLQRLGGALLLVVGAVLVVSGIA